MRTSESVRLRAMNSTEEHEQWPRLMALDGTESAREWSMHEVHLILRESRMIDAHKALLFATLLIARTIRAQELRTGVSVQVSTSSSQATILFRVSIAISAYITTI